MTNFNRIASIDIMRGLTILLMLFVNDLNMDVAPKWLGHMPAGYDGMGLADWVFPAFLFIAGLSIPFALSKRISDGLANIDNSKRIFMRTVSLLIIGVLMLNTGRVDQELTGINKYIWAILMYIAVFLIWNDYTDKENRIYPLAGFRLAGIGILIYLIFRFRSGETVNDGSLITGWWGILGLIGWGYLAASFIYLLIRDSIPMAITASGFFLLLNILSALKVTAFLDPARPLLGVIIDGNVPFIVMSGVVAGLIVKRLSAIDFKWALQYLIVLGAIFLIGGFALRNWFILSKIEATPSWALVSSGVSLIVFSFIYWIADVRKLTSWASFFRPAGENSLTTYIATEIIYNLIWLTGLPVLLHKQSAEPAIAIGGSLLWAFLIVWLTAFLVRFNIKLKI